MKKIIQAFLDSKKIAIVGVSEKKDNWGKSIMNELTKKGYEILPVNPKYEMIDSVKCYPSVKDLPADTVSVILAVPPSVTEKVVEEMSGTGIKRVWMHRGVGKGASSEKAKELCAKNSIDVVYGFCPMMFFGTGMHKFHFWMRKNLGKMPEEYLLSPEIG